MLKLFGEYEEVEEQQKKSSEADDLAKKSSQGLLDLDSMQGKKLRISRMPNVAKAILDKYAAVKRELQLLIDANEAYDKKKGLHDKAESEAKQLNDLIVERMAGIELKLNTQMDKMNETLYPDEMKAPLVHVEASNKYTFYTPDDGGTGMRYKGLVLFDPAVLHESKLPFIIHDSVLLLQIENEVLEKLLVLYSKQADKQVFIFLTKYPHLRNKKSLMRQELSILAEVEMNCSVGLGTEEPK